MNFTYKESALISDKILNKFSGNLISKIKEINKIINGYNTLYAPLSLPSDKDLIISVNNMVKLTKNLNPKLFMLIGIGGSNLGTLAIHEALQGKFYNSLNPELLFYCADTIDNNYTNNLLAIAERELKNNNNIIINIVTKSGTTTETLVNSALFINLIKKYKPDYKKYIVITTDYNSQLWKIAQQEQYNILEIPKLVGGRFSVLSSVGLFPLAMLDINIEELMAGALASRTNYLNQNINNNYAAISALISYIYFKNGKNINNLFVFSPDLANLGAWYRQLVAESLGKKQDKTKAIVETGMTPIVSIGTTDLHSVAQLYLGGPRDKLTTFLSFRKEEENLIVPDTDITKILPIIKNKSVTFIKKSILKAVKLAYLKEERPFMSIILPENNAYYLGQFLMFKMIETIYIGELLNINTFDQPAVELYKEEARRLLNEQ